MKNLNLIFSMTLIAMLSIFTACEKEENDEPAVLDPVAEFDYEVSENNELQVTFTNLSTNAETYMWAFGDGETSTEDNPVHEYAEGGTYEVVLTATSADNVSADVTKTLSINSSPDPDPVAEFEYEVSDGNPLQVNFTNLSTNAETYLWAFGDGETSTEENPVHEYAEGGNYEVVLTATNANDLSADVTKTLSVSSPVEVTVDFDVTVEGFDAIFENLSVGAVSYEWDFGDGNTSTEENPTHTYAAEGSYQVVLTGTSASGETNIAEKSVTISTGPTTLPDAPTEDEANVISIYSDAYTSIDGINLDPDWGQETIVEEVELSGEMILKMADLNYQGIEWSGNPQDVTDKTHIHVDVYCTATTEVNLSVIGGGAENPVQLTTEAGVWKSFDIELSQYTSPDLSQVIQVKFDDAGTGASPTIFVDNIYFY